MTENKDMLRVTVEDGKYTLVQDHTGKQFALRYGQPWRDLVGDGLTLALGYRIEELKAEVEGLENACADWCTEYEMEHTYRKERVKALTDLLKRVVKFVDVPQLQTEIATILEAE